MDIKGYFVAERDDNSVTISKIAPYDEQEYYWAKIKDDTKIYRDCEFILKIDITDVNKIIDELIKMNNKLEQKIDRS